MMRNAAIYGLLVFSIYLFMPLAASAVEVGQEAPDFELNSTQGGKLKLSDFRGKKNVLIEFYVLDFLPG